MGPPRKGLVKKGLKQVLALVAAFGLGVGFISSAWAQTNGTNVAVSLEGLGNQNVRLADFNFANLSTISVELGFATSIIMAPSSYPMIAISDERGVKIILQPINCTGIDLFKDTCTGMLMSAVVTGLPGISLERINAFNDAQFFSRGHLVSGNRAVLSRLLIADYGIAKGNLGIEIYSFRSSLYNYGRFLNTVQVSESGAQANPGARGLVGGGSLKSPGFDLKDEPANAPALLEAMHLLDEYTTKAEDLFYKD